MCIRDRHEASEKTMNDMKNFVVSRLKTHNLNWGFKFPDVTLCYDIWKDVLPYHVAIGVIRDRKDIIAHYLRRKKQRHSVDIINMVCDNYEALLHSYGVPIVHYNDIMKHGPIILEEILKIPLKDCRRFKK